jgi:hypothetical protein
MLTGLAALVLTDAGAASELAWLGAGAAALALIIGLAGGSPASVHAAVALLGAIFLARDSSRLLLAAPYGAGLLLLEDLAVQTIELRDMSQIAPGMIGARSAETFVFATMGACASAAAALVVTVAPGRSVALTALGALAAVAAIAAVVRLARRRYGPGVAAEQAAAPGASTGDGP